MKKRKVSAPRAMTEEILGSALRQAGTMNALAGDLGIRVGTVCQWYRGSQPREDHLLGLEAYLTKGKRGERRAASELG